MSTLTTEEYRRYARHLVLPEVGMTGQEKLKSAKVLVIGAGGLGAPLIAYLAAGGVGTIGIVDFDQIDLTNLQRQILYTVDDVGHSKAITSAQWIKALNPQVTVNVHELKLDHTNALEIIKAYDIVADGSDNFATRYLVNDACFLTGKPLVYGSIFRFEGQVSVFNLELKAGERGPNYRDIFPEPPPSELIPNCADGGVLGVLPGIIGSMQASEVIKIICGIGHPLSGELLMIDVLHHEYRTMKFNKNSLNPLYTSPGIQQLIDYELFCNIANKSNTMVKSINVLQLKEMLQQGQDFQLIDVREPWEYALANLNGLLIPKGEVEKHFEKIEKNKMVVVQCRSGVRSADVIVQLQKKYQVDNLYNLEGGILAWSREIDPTVPIY